MTTNTSAKQQITVGQRVRVLNKFSDEIADGFVVEVDRNGFSLKSDSDLVHICWRHIVELHASEITLSVVGDTLETTA